MNIERRRESAESESEENGNERVSDREYRE